METIKQRIRTRFSMNVVLQNAVQNHSKEVNDHEKNNSLLPLARIVDIVQDELKKIEGSAEDHVSYRDLIYRAGLGYPNEQEKVKAIIRKIISEKRLYAIPEPILSRMSLADAVFALSIGAGLIEDLYKDKEVEEVQVNGTDIYVMKRGVSRKHERTFSSMEDVIRLQERLALYGRTTISEQNPKVETYMYNHSRLTMTQFPYSAVPSIAIRNFNFNDFSLDYLVQLETLNDEMKNLLKLLVVHHASILIAGSTKAGKTTMLFALAREIPAHERILTLETEFELFLHERLGGNRNIVSFQALPELGLDMEKAFHPLLRLSPDRIIVGEIRGKEAAQAVQAALRGHDTIVTVHSKYRDMLLSDILDMVKQDGRNHDDYTVMARIGRAFNIVIYLTLIPINEFRARRIIREISEIRYDLAKKETTIVPLFRWNSEKKEFERTGNKISEELMEHMMIYRANKDDFKRIGVY